MTIDRRTAGVCAVGAILAGVFASAFVLAPRACEGGLELYFWSGVAGLVALVILPFLVRLGGSVLGSVGWAFGFFLLGASVWVGGLAAANVRIVCRLF